jgi:hypothetical protein
MEKKVEDLKTYKNRNGLPILRRCKNCIFWNPDTHYEEKMNLGFCTLKPYYFAFTLAPNLYALTKEFYLCAEHKLKNEEKLEQVSDSMPLKDALKNKKDI